MDSLPSVLCLILNLESSSQLLCTAIASYVYSYAVEYLQIVMVFILEILSQISYLTI